MKKIRNMQRPRFATVMAVLALFIVLGGTATAASMINGKNIKKGTITAKQLKNKTITKGKLAPATVKSLNGAKGATGAAGAKGATGATGAQGIQGVPGTDGVIASGSETEIGPQNVAANVDKTIVSLNVSSGRYAVSADFNYASASTDLVNCALKSGSTFIALSGFNATVGKNSIAINGVTNNPVTTLSVVCNSTAAGQASNIHIVAIPVAS